MAIYIVTSSMAYNMLSQNI